MIFQKIHFIDKMNFLKMTDDNIDFLYEISCLATAVDFSLIHLPLYIDFENGFNDIENTILLNPNIFWNYHRLSIYSRISERFIDTYIHLPWNFKLLSLRQDLSDSFISKYIFKDWDFDMLSYNPNLSIKTISLALDKDWNYLVMKRIFDNEYKSMKYYSFTTFGDIFDNRLYSRDENFKML
jgi:hypothetical protein